MVNSEYSKHNCKTLQISIRAIMKNPEILKFVPDHLTIKKVCKHAIKKIPFVIK